MVMVPAKAIAAATAVSALMISGCTTPATTTFEPSDDLILSRSPTEDGISFDAAWWGTFVAKNGCVALQLDDSGFAIPIVPTTAELVKDADGTYGIRRDGVTYEFGKPVMGGGGYFTAKDFPDLPEVARCVEAVGTPAEDSVVVISDITIDE